MYIMYQVKPHEIVGIQLYFGQENQLFHIVQPNTTWNKCQKSKSKALHMTMTTNLSAHLPIPTPLILTMA